MWETWASFSGWAESLYKENYGRVSTWFNPHLELIVASARKPTRWQLCLIKQWFWPIPKGHHFRWWRVGLADLQFWSFRWEWGESQTFPRHRSFWKMASADFQVRFLGYPPGGGCLEHQHWTPNNIISTYLNRNCFGDCGISMAYFWNIYGYLYMHGYLWYPLCGHLQIGLQGCQATTAPNPWLSSSSNPYTANSLPWQVPPYFSNPVGSFNPSNIYLWPLWQKRY